MRRASTIAIGLSSLLASGCVGVLSVAPAPGAFDAGTHEDSGARLDAGPPVDTGPPPDVGPPFDAGPAPDTGPNPPDAGPPDRDAGVEPVIDAGACSGAGVTDGFSRTPIPSASPRSGAVFAAPTSVGGIVAAWPAADGMHTRRIDGGGRPVGPEIVTPGNALWGLDVNDDDEWAILVDRGSDEMWLVGLRPDGSTRFEERLLGAVDHSVTENEWFGAQLRAGRLHWDANRSRWAAYVTVQRLWNDGIAHYGDTLRFHGADGAAMGSGWSWGCSHSMEVRITSNAAGIGPLCISDCFPGKGVFFHHRTEVFLDSSGDCAGRIDSRIGGIAPAADGFWATWTAAEGRSSTDVALVHIGDDRSVDPIRWLTSDGAADSHAHLARYGAGFVAGWAVGGADRVQRLDGSGAPIGAPADLPEATLAASSDFIVLAGGDVAWVSSSGGELSLVRLRVCE